MLILFLIIYLGSLISIYTILYIEWSNNTSCIENTIEDFNKYIIIYTDYVPVILWIPIVNTIVLIYYIFVYVYNKIKTIRIR